MATDSAGLRKRGAGQANGNIKHTGGQLNASIEKSKAGGVSVIDVLRILGGLLLLNCLLSYFITNDSVLWGWRPWFVRPNALMARIVRRIFFIAEPTSHADDNPSEDL